MATPIIQPERAPVRPRVLSPSNGTALLEQEVQGLIDAGVRGTVAIVGPPRSGRTTSLAHLLAVFSDQNGWSGADVAGSSEAVLLTSTGLTLCTASALVKLPKLAAKFHLASWTRDDFIEYLLSTRADRCASVMRRLTADDIAFLGGNPELCRIACDQLLADEALMGAPKALQGYLSTLFVKAEVHEKARKASLAAMARGFMAPSIISDLPKEVSRLVRHRMVQVALAAEALAKELREGRSPKVLGEPLPRELIQSVAAEIREDQAVQERLIRVYKRSRISQPMIVSLLHAVGSRPPGFGRRPYLREAYLAGAVWPKVTLARGDLTKADLQGADLGGANLNLAVLHGTSLCEAKLTGANLARARFYRADLSHCILSGVSAEGASFDEANLEGARFDNARLQRSSFSGANLCGADFSNADLSHSVLTSANIAQAEFLFANFNEAHLVGLPLRKAELRGASFVDAELTQCDLEGVELPGANFTGATLDRAWLSGSSMLRANFHHASLRDTGLAEINLEGASLIGADLRGATFHMGGSRSGLVGSPIACEGSRTGFYTDEYEEQHFKSPEEIRKANLCGCDLRGALIKGVDFYLVDLRDARFDPEQEEHLRRCGAILETHV